MTAAPTPVGEVWRHLRGLDPRHGPLPPLLLALTFTSGLVDAVSIIRLDHVFVANMTGNVAFIGLAIGGAPGFSLVANAVALLAFLVGAGVQGVLLGTRARERGATLAIGVAIEFVLVAVATTVVALGDDPPGDAARNATVVALAMAMGVQTATARRVAVPDFTTTVLTSTLTGIGADVTTRRGRAAALRRGAAVVALIAGGAVGAVIVLHGGIVPALLAVLGVQAVVGVVAVLADRRPGEWQQPT